METQFQLSKIDLAIIKANKNVNDLKKHYPVLYHQMDRHRILYDHYPHPLIKKKSKSKTTIKLRANSQINTILQWFKGRQNGATCEDVEKALGIVHQAASARLSELVKLGCLRTDGKKPNIKGKRVTHYYFKSDLIKYREQERTITGTFISPFTDGRTYMDHLRDFIRDQSTPLNFVETLREFCNKHPGAIPKSVNGALTTLRKNQEVVFPRGGVISLNTEMSNKRIKAQALAIELALKHPDRECTIDDVQAICIPQGIMLGHSAGGVFRNQEWEQVGVKVSTRHENRKRLITVWRLKPGVVATSP